VLCSALFQHQHTKLILNDAVKTFILMSYEHRV